MPSAVRKKKAAPSPAATAARVHDPEHDPAHAPEKAPESVPARARDAEQTRARILAAAKAEFARVGLAGARVDRIGELAGANKRMLYYYFGSKDGLFRAVLEAAYEHIRESERALHLDEVDPPEAIRRLVSFTWDYFLKHPEFMSLLATENLHQAEHLKHSTRVRSMHSPFVAMIETLLARGRASGQFREGVDAVQLYISIAGLAYFYLANNHTLSAIFGRNLKAPAARQARLTHMTELVLGYLRKLD